MQIMAYSVIKLKKYSVIKLKKYKLSKAKVWVGKEGGGVYNFFDLNQDIAKIIKK